MSESHNPEPDSTIVDTFINSLYQTKFIHMYSINLMYHTPFVNWGLCVYPRTLI
jgi:hypothetical protein